MADPKTVRLRVEMPNPGEWCRRWNHSCWLWNESSCNCRLGHRHRLADIESYGYRRPQSCKDAEESSPWPYGDVDLDAFLPEDWEPDKPIDFKTAVRVMFTGGLVIYAHSLFCCYSKAFCTYEHGTWWEKEFSGSDRSRWLSVKPRTRKDAEVP